MVAWGGFSAAVTVGTAAPGVTHALCTPPAMDLKIVTAVELSKESTSMVNWFYYGNARSNNKKQEPISSGVHITSSY